MSGEIVICIWYLKRKIKQSEELRYYLFIRIILCMNKKTVKVYKSQLLTLFC